jgi:hypothetical protein
MKIARVLAVVGVLCAKLALAGQPFGGGHTGFVPPNVVAHNCASKAMLSNAKLWQAIGKCHIDLANELFKGSSASDEDCETAAKGKFDTVLAKMFDATQCPDCLITNTNGMSEAFETAIDDANGLFYCDGSTPFGDDHTGFVPSDATILKCESAVLKNVFKYLACLQKCHRKMSSYGLRDRSFDEAACATTDPLKSCLAKYNLARDKLVPKCPGCLDQVAQDDLASGTKDFVDQTLGTFYCLSPSGAFLDLP